MRTAILASQNKNKIKEIRAILEKYGLHVITRDDAGIPTDDIEETGTTFEENSHLKASVIMDMIAGDPALAEYLDSPVIADDSGLMVDALGGAPGVLSARYAGEGATDAEKINKLLTELMKTGSSDRSARFECVICCYFPNGEKIFAHGTCEGTIGYAPRGANGFGYDPVFLVNGYDITMAQMSEELKNKISHRANALSKMIRFIKENL